MRKQKKPDRRTNSRIIKIEIHRHFKIVLFTQMNLNYQPLNNTETENHRLKYLLKLGLI